MKLLFPFFLLFCVACSSGYKSGVRCSNGKALKHKSYRVKQPKNKSFAGYSASSSSSKSTTPASAKPSPNPAKSTETASVQQTPQNVISITKKQKSTNSSSTPTNNSGLTSVSTTIITEIKPIETVSSPINHVAKIRIPYNPDNELVFESKVYKKDEDINFTANIEFVPNYAILLYKNSIEAELAELVKLLKEHPEKEVKIYGNGGLEVEEFETEEGIHYQWVPESKVQNNESESEIIPTPQSTVDEEDVFYQADPNSVFGKRERILYGSSSVVHKQTIYNIGNTDEHHLKRIKEEGKFPVSEAEVGKLLYARAKFVKDYLIEQGISKKRLKAYAGTYSPFANHTVFVQIANGK